MKGLLIKDLLFTLKSAKTFLILIIFWSILGIANSMGPAMVGIFPLILMSSLAGHDEKTNFYRLVKTMPISIKNIVYARYSFLGIMIILCLLFCLIISFIFTSLNSDISFTAQMLSSLSVSAVCCAMVLILYPLQIKYGVEKARIWIFIIVAMGTLLIGVVSLLGVTDILKNYTILILLGILFVVLLFIFSVNISKKIFEQKEF